MTNTAPPTLEEFLKAPVSEIAPVAPATLIFAAGGTRRSAAFAGISPEGDEFAKWSRVEMITCFDMIFRHGVQNIISHAIIPSQYKEVTGGYRQALTRWTDWGLSGPEALADYARLGWRVRLLGTEKLPDLQTTAARLIEETASPPAPTLWYTVTPSETSAWELILEAAHRTQAKTQQEAIRALYGEDLPPATLIIGSGKPGVFPAIVPPLLMGKLEGYWKQSPGFRMAERTFCEILYDYAYARATWRQDKTGRAEQALAHRAVWEKAPMLGLGMRLGPFWYPQPIPHPLSQQDET